MISRIRYWVVPYAEPNDHNSTRFSVLLCVEDSSGAEGWGEAVTIFEESARSTAAILDGWHEMLLGLDPEPASIREIVYRRGWWYAGGGSGAFALSALDTAVWDLKGKLLGQSVLDMLGGPATPEDPTLPIIVTTHAFFEDLAEQSDFLAKWVKKLDGHGVKVGWGKKGPANLGFDARRDEQFVGQLRQSLGPEPLIMLDIGPAITWSPEEALNRVKSFEPHDVYWIEEPLGADNPEGYSHLKQNTDMLIAYGEREWSAVGIRRILATETVDVVGIDAGRAEGITGFADAVKSIGHAGKQANAHAFAGPPSYAAGLAVSLTTSACRQFEVAPLRNDLMTEIAPELSTPTGRVSPLNGAGLGLDISYEAVNRLSVSVGGTP